MLARVAIGTIGFPRVRRFLEETRSRAARGDAFPAAVRRAVGRAARTVPGTGCLAQSVAAYRLLRAGGRPAELTIGVRRRDTASGGLDAHAWVRSGTLLVTGDAGDVDVSAFTVMAHIRGGA